MVTKIKHSCVQAVPVVFAASGAFHPSSLVFIDWFLVRASHVPVSEPPFFEKLKVLQAISSAIVDQTASILATHFSKYIYDPAIVNHANFHVFSPEVSLTPLLLAGACGDLGVLPVASTSTAIFTHQLRTSHPCLPVHPSRHLLSPRLPSVYVTTASGPGDLDGVIVAGFRNFRDRAGVLRFCTLFML